MECRLLDTAQRRFLGEEASFCSRCSRYEGRQLNTHLYGCSEAYRWNGKYIYYCPLGLVFAASPVMDERGEMAGGFVAGPMVMGDPGDTIAECPAAEMKEALARLPALDPGRINHLAEILAATTSYVSGLPHSKAGAFVYEQERLLNTIYELNDSYRAEGAAPAYPLQQERRLQEYIRSRDKEASLQLLNDLLGRIFLSSGFDLGTVKARTTELVGLLSRATIDAGADMNEIFRFSSESLRELERFDSIEDLSAWATGILHRFINYAFDFAQIKHNDAVRKVMDYVKRNYAKKLTLEEIARNAYLSRAYLSSIFKEETGESLSSYINRVRIDKSRSLLLDPSISLVEVANRCGFEDQSYFTRVFKRITGVSPKRYRDSGGYFA